MIVVLLESGALASDLAVAIVVSWDLLTSATIMVVKGTGLAAASRGKFIFMRVVEEQPSKRIISASALLSTLAIAS